MIIEWNVHMFSADVKRYPFHAQASYRPAPDSLEDDPLAGYQKRMLEVGIDRAVLVQPEPYGDDHSLLLACLQRDPQRLKGTSLFYPKDPRAPEKLAALVRREPRIVSTRFHAHRGKEEYLDSFADPGVRALWKAAADLGLVVELHIGPDYAEQAADAIRAFPNTPVLIDHLAEPHMGDAVEFAHVLELSKLSNVYMKLSGLSHFAQDEPLFLSAQPFTRWVVDAFGPDRLVWGEGTPKVVDAHLSEYSETDRRKVKGETLARLLNWTER